MTGTKSLDKALNIFKYVLTDGSADVKDMARTLDLPIATVYRHMAALERQGLIRRVKSGIRGPGPDLLALTDPESFRRLLVESARPIVDKTAKRLGLQAQLGILENDMVTYLIKATRSEHEVLFQENQQLEAYCSGIGKVLLANISEDMLDAYLQAGPFLSITKNTITSKDKFRVELAAARKNGYAFDNAEFTEGLFCVAVPVFDSDDRVIAAISASSHAPEDILGDTSRVTGELSRAAEAIREEIYTSRKKG